MRERHGRRKISGAASQSCPGTLSRIEITCRSRTREKTDERFWFHAGFDLKGGLPAARKFCDRIQLFLLAASLGGVESLVVLPIYTSHYNMSLDELAAAGVTPGTVRVSVGLEDVEDLLADLKQALA